MLNIKLLMKKVYSFLFFFISVFIFHDVYAQLPELIPPPPPPPEACDVGGTYSVGPGGNFVTVTEALDSLRLRGVSTNVILELAADYNSSAEIFPITFPINDKLIVSIPLSKFSTFIIWKPFKFRIPS